MEEKGIEKPYLPSAQQHGDQKSFPGEAAITRDGFHVHPQPTSDSLDPLNWTNWRKNSILAIICFKYWLFTYITTTT